MNRRTFLTQTATAAAGLTLLPMVANAQTTAMTSQPITTVSLPGNLKIHAISTGQVAVTDAFLHAGNLGFLRKANILFNRHFADWMPIHVWVIEHPEGIFVIDTGENAAITNADYFNSVGMLNEYVNTHAFRFEVAREEEIDRQLAQLGIRPSDVRAVVLTHLHIDHTDGLRHFPKTPVLLNRYEAERPYNDLPQLYPATFAPTLIDLKPVQTESFAKAHPLTTAGDLWLVETPGHSHGHCSVLLQTGQQHYLFAGDVSYTQQQLLTNDLPGANASLKQSQQTYLTIRDYAAKHPLVYLPSHDGDAARRLAMGETLPVVL
ncbi:N-acyl homoserine lactonase family protein [Spirosoma spitsbergense]|uniref:N-acyl homoserine lactonase family protein n=1 Tax=Spirosoma spitsbergense TaxID=431554 RepID=UPI000375F690|nr:N-acyl homoserine lactonase family protein [Spirosoma spitsbergense]